MPRVPIHPFRQNRSRPIALLAALVLGLAGPAGPVHAQKRKPVADRETVYITLLAATAVADSALLDHVLPKFEDKTGYRVQVIAGRTARILDLARKGGGDVMIGNDPDSEKAFLAAGHASKRAELMFTDLVIAGPKTDPARISGMASVIDAMRRIARTRSTWYSRPKAGLLSRLEAAFWSEAGYSPLKDAGGWHRSLDEDVEAALRRAARKEGYILTDRAGWLRFGNSARQLVLVEGDPRMFVQHGIMLVARKDPPKDKAGRDRLKAVEALYDWLLSKEGGEAIAGYQIGDIQPYAPNSRD